MKEEIAILKATVKELDEKRNVLVNAIDVLSGKGEAKTWKTKKSKKQGRPKGSKNRVKEDAGETTVIKFPKAVKTPKIEKPADDENLPTLPMKRGKGSPFADPV
jgi:hypothetical protein